MTGYLVERCTGAGCSGLCAGGDARRRRAFNDTGLTAATSYSYRVRATDAAGNLSGYSNMASATHAGGRGHAAADGAERAGRRRRMSSSQINLSWTASTDNVAVTGYLVERCTAGGRARNFAQVGDRHERRAFNDSGTDGLDQLQLPGAGDRCGGQPERLLDSGERDDDGGRRTRRPPTVPAGWGDGADRAAQINLPGRRDGQRGGDRLSGGALHGGGRCDFAQVGTPGASFDNTGLSADQLQLPGARDRCGEQPERLFEHESDDAGGADTQAPTAPAGWVTATRQPDQFAGRRRPTTWG